MMMPANSLGTVGKASWVAVVPRTSVTVAIFDCQGLVPHRRRRGDELGPPQRRSLLLRVQRAPQAVRRLSVQRRLLLDLLLSHKPLIRRVFLRSADVEASAFVRVGKRVPDVAGLIPRDELERWHDADVMNALGIVGVAHLKSRRDKQLLRAARLVPTNGRAPGQRKERGDENESAMWTHGSFPFLSYVHSDASVPLPSGVDRTVETHTLVQYILTRRDE